MASLATNSTGQLRSQIGVMEIDQKIKLEVLRGGQLLSFKVNVGEQQKLSSMNPLSHDLLQGVHFESSTDHNGVVVSGLSPNSRAAYSGLRPEDLIVAVNKRRIIDLNSFNQALSLNLSTILLQINRNGGFLFVAIR